MSSNIWIYNVYLVTTDTHKLCTGEKQKKAQTEFSLAELKA